MMCAKTIFILQISHLYISFNIFCLALDLTQKL